MDSILRLAKEYSKDDHIYLLPCDDNNILEKINSQTDLYWRPYYIGEKDNPEMILYANSSCTSNPDWRANIVYVNGKIYQCNIGISSYYSYKNVTDLEALIQSQPQNYKLIE